MIGRVYEHGPMTEDHVIPGAIILTMTFDRPGDFVRMHSHAFDHDMLCVSGSARVVIDDVQTILRAGEKYLVEAHKRHGLWPLESGTVLQCIHYHDDIHPDKAPGPGIPLEWLSRLTDHTEQADNASW